MLRRVPPEEACGGAMGFRPWGSTSDEGQMIYVGKLGSGLGKEIRLTLTRGKPDLRGSGRIY